MSEIAILTAAKELLGGGWKFLTGNLWRTSTLAALLAVGVFYVKAETYKHELATCEQARFDDTTATELAGAQSQIDNLNHVVVTERLNAEIAKEKQHEIEGQLTAARGAAARYASLHPAPQVNPGGTGQDRLPGAAEPAPGAPATAAEAVVPVADLDACAIDYTIAAGWQDWWQKVSQAQPDTEGQTGTKPAG